MDTEINLNPLGLEVGKEYWLRHKPSNGPWEKVRITRFNSMGYPWSESITGRGNGMISGECYEKRDVTAHTELCARARTFLEQKGISLSFLKTGLAELLALFYNEVEPDYNKKGKYITPLTPDNMLLFEETNKHNPTEIAEKGVMNEKTFGVIIDYNTGLYTFVNTITHEGGVKNEHFTPANPLPLSCVEDFKKLWESVTGKRLNYRINEQGY